MHPSLQEWTLTLLSKNGLARADGRPLYAYRVSDESFAQLFEILRNKTNISADLAGRKTAYFAQCWLVYAAEWWKRSYAGGSWSWSPIFDTLGYEDPGHETRRDWVATAAAYWKLNDDAIGGKKYIGKVVVNGGLPLKLIREADGSLSRLLHTVLNEAILSSTPLNSAQILSQIDLQRSYLPKSYRQHTVYLLLAQVIGTVLELKTKLTNLGDQDPVAYLDKTDADWLNAFPLQIDTDSARRLLSKLIRQAVTTIKRSKQLFSIIRQLRFNSDFSDWQYECLLDALTRHSVNAIAHMLNRSEDELPASLDLVITSSNLAMTIGQMLRRGEDYLIKLNKPRLPNDWFHRSLRLEVSRFGQTLGALEIQGSEGPDPLVPWIFEDINPVSRLLWAGSYKLSASSCLVLSPDTAIASPGNHNVLCLAANSNKKIYRVTESETHISIQNENFQIKCSAQEGELAEGIVWGNNRLFIDSSPSHIFLGTPKLDRVDSEGARRAVPGTELFWRCNNVESAADNIRNYGVGTLFWRKQGKTLLRLKAVCLSSEQQDKIDSHLEYAFSKNIKPNGIIKLNGWPISSVLCNTENVSIKSTHHNNQWELNFVSEVTPPSLMLSLTLGWPDGQMQRISIPFPIEGAFIVDQNGVPINTNSIISLKQANQLRVHLRALANKPWQIRMRLENTVQSQRTPDQVVKFRSSSVSPSQEVRLYDLQNQIRQLLSLTTDLDARVRVSFECSEQIKNAITIARYSHNLERDLGKGWVTLDDASGEVSSAEILAQSGLRAVPILEVEQASRPLTPIFSQETHVGSWDFQPEIKQPGTWLIYPSPDSAVNARPITWIVPERFAKPEPQLSGIRAAMNIQKREDRLAALVDTFKIIAENPTDPDWKYLQTFVDKLGHLPLASLDLWVAMVQVPRAVVSAFLTLENFTDKIADRICNELPFEWLLSSPQDWLIVIAGLRKQAQERGGEREERFLKNDLEYRLEWIQERYPALHLSVKLALVKGLGIDDPETQLLISRPNLVVGQWLPGLLTNDESDAQNFIRRASQNASYDVPAPNQLKAQTEKFAQSESGRGILVGFKLNPDDWKYSLVVAPLMIAYAVAKGEASTWLEKTEKIFAFRQYREFDRHWFDECYKVAMACAFNERLITV